MTIVKRKCGFKVGSKRSKENPFAESSKRISLSADLLKGKELREKLEQRAFSKELAEINGDGGFDIT
jgi:hypothetical protein